MAKTEETAVATTRSGAAARNSRDPNEASSVTIDDTVVSKIAGLAAREIPGVNSMGKSFRRLLGRVQPGDSSTQGVNVEVGTKEAAVDLVIVVDYGVHIPTVAEQVQSRVAEQIEAMTHFSVKEVNVEVTDVSIELPPGGRVE